MNASMRLDDTIEHYETNAAPRSVVDRLLRSGWFLVLFVALLVASSPPRSEPLVAGSPAVTSSRAVFVGVVPQTILFDRALTTRVLHGWKSRKFDSRDVGYVDGSALASATTNLVVPVGRSGAIDRELGEAPRRLPFRHFDAQAPPLNG
jgi:hypothetical protein